MKYKAGDKVRIKSLDWYNENKDEYGYIDCGSRSFFAKMSDWCGKIATIKEICKTNCYRLEEYDFDWTDDMIEGLVEEEAKFDIASNRILPKSNTIGLTQELVNETIPKLKFKVGDKVILDPYPCIVTDVHWRDSLHGFVYTVRGDDFGKIVKEDELVFDERTVPNTNKIIQLIKNDWNNFKDRYDIPDDYHFVDKNGNEINISDIVLEKKKPKYTKNIFTCTKILGTRVEDQRIEGYKEGALGALQTLLIYRDAYWKIAGDWKANWNTNIVAKYCIGACMDRIEKHLSGGANYILAFPTEEMRDAFYENFKDLIEECKELL